jgi:hypothetical protein
MGKVPDDFDGAIFGAGGGGLVFHGRDGPKELVGDVGQNGGATRGDTVFGEEKEKTGEKVVDGGCGLEFGDAGGEGGGQIRGAPGGLDRTVTAAKKRRRAGGRASAAAAGGGAVLTAGKVNGYVFHFGPLD